LSNPAVPAAGVVTSSSSGKNKSAKDPLNPSKEEKQLIQELRKQNEQFKLAKEQADMKTQRLESDMKAVTDRIALLSERNTK
jgi:hypothetical protein